jgi:lysophospholipase L1-like esterase
MVRRPALLALTALSLLTLCRTGYAGTSYLAIGDSLAFGETDFLHNPSNGDRGYVSLFANTLKSLSGGVRPNVINLGFDGETTGSFFNGMGNVFGPSATASLMNTNYYQNGNPMPTIQNVMMLNTIASTAAAGNPIGYVTVSLGANDLYGLLADPNFFKLPSAEQLAKIMMTLGGIQANYTNLLFELKSQLPGATVILVGYYNPFAALVGTPLAAASPTVVQALNEVIKGEAQAFGDRYVDTYTPFLGHEATYTYILSSFAGAPNVHPNDLGYSVIGAQLANAVPEPGSLTLAGIGVMCLIVPVLRRSMARKWATDALDRVKN